MNERCAATKGVDERIDEGALKWLDPVERMENDKRDYVGVCWGNNLRP